MEESGDGFALVPGDRARCAPEIRVRGELTPALVSMVEALNLRTEQTEGGPILVGVFRDQAELNGALQALSDIGVELVAVQQLDNHPAEDFRLRSQADRQARSTAVD